MKAITEEGLRSWIDTLAGQYGVIAPRQVEGKVVYQRVGTGAEMVLSFERSVMSPKSAVWPDTEVILEVDIREEEVALTEPKLARDQVLIGIRPCDAQGMCSLDGLLMDHEPADAYYAERRARTTLVGLACPTLWDGCFCTSLGGAPDDTSHVDLMLYESDDGFLLLEVTDKGTALLDGLDLEESDAPAPPSEATGERVPVPAPEKWQTRFDDAYWQRLAERCLSCHACTYVCPTCRCVDVRDRTMAAGSGQTQIERLRAWDSCLAAGYRRIAGGHNPRPDKTQRLRNRFYCKFCYSPLTFDAVACVGCGRCIAACPVGIDISEVLGDVDGLAGAESQGQGSGGGDP